MQDRIYSFDGISNFRDFGGYPTQDGGRVVAKRLFRSAHLGTPSEADRAALDALDIRVILDLRRPHERAKEPNVWPESGRAETIHMPAEKEDGAEAPHIAFLRQPNLTRQSVAEFIQLSYRRLPFDPRHVYLYGAYFNALDRIREGGSLVHCAFGKDRTGILCGVMLMALGVPEDLVVEDFELTNKAVDLESNLPQAQARYQKTYGVSPELSALIPLLGVEGDYLRAAFDEMRVRHGSVEGYLDLLGVDAAQRDRLKTRFVQ